MVWAEQFPKLFMPWCTRNASSVGSGTCVQRPTLQPAIIIFNAHRANSGIQHTPSLQVDVSRMSCDRRQVACPGLPRDSPFSPLSSPQALRWPGRALDLKMISTSFFNVWKYPYGPKVEMPIMYLRRLNQTGAVISPST